MSTSQRLADPPGVPAEPRPPGIRSPRSGPRGWFGQLLLRLHFYAGIFIGPFIVVAALSGALYAVAPSLEKVVYAQELTAPVTDQVQPLAQQVAAAEQVVGEAGVLLAVRPAPEPGSTTRVMFSAPGLAESESRAIFIDPATAQVRGDLTVYGSSGSLPLRTWSSNLHRSLNLGEPGRIYSELAASWLGIVVLAGAGLWIVRFRKTRAKRGRQASWDLIRPNRKATGYRRLLSWHSALGVWVLLGALFLSATGITWSQFAGENVSNLRSALEWKTPAVSTALDGAEAATGTGAHAGHGAEPTPAAPVAATDFDRVLAAARAAGIDASRVQIKVPAGPGRAWAVSELEGGSPTDADQVAINPESFAVTDQVRFADFPLAAKLTKWGIALHMGTLFGLANQILLFLTAMGITAMTVLGYLMWWKRRPTRGRAGTKPMKFGKPAAAGALAKAPWWGVLSVVLAAAGIGLFLPLVGITLLAFVLLDSLVTAKRTTTPQGATDGANR